MSVTLSFVQQNIIYSDKTEKASDIEASDIRKG